MVVYKHRNGSLQVIGMVIKVIIMVIRSDSYNSIEGYLCADKCIFECFVGTLTCGCVVKTCMLVFEVPRVILCYKI